MNNLIKKFSFQGVSGAYSELAGKKIYPEDLRSWFISLYQILFGSNNGPRLGSLFYLYKKEKVLKILEEVIK